MKARICRVLIALGMFGTTFNCQSAARSDRRETVAIDEDAQNFIHNLRALIGASTIELSMKISEFKKFVKAIEDGEFVAFDPYVLQAITEEIENELKKLKLEKITRTDEARKAYLEQRAKENARHLDHYLTTITQLASSESPDLSVAQKLQHNLKSDIEAMRVPTNDITENLLKTLEEVISRASKESAAEIKEVEYDSTKTDAVWKLFETDNIPWNRKVDINEVFRLLASRVDLNSLDKKGSQGSLFLRMLELNRYDKVTTEYIDLLLSYPGLNLFQTDSSGYTILHKLAYKQAFSSEHEAMGRYVIRQILKKAPALLNAQTDGGYTPLMIAVVNFNEYAVEEFLMSVLRLDLKDCDKLDALQLAKKKVIDLRKWGSHEAAEKAEAIIKLIIDYIERKKEISEQLTTHNFPSVLCKIIGDYEEGVLDQKESASMVMS